MATNSRLCSIIMVGFFFIVAGCQSLEILNSDKTETLTLKDFVSTSAGSVGPIAIENDTNASTTASSSVEAANTGNAESDGNVINTTVSSDERDIEPARQLQPGEVMIIDSLVGQINGRPVYANAFFEPIGALLRAKATQETQFQFNKTLTETVTLRLQEIFQNEVLLAEAENRLTPEERQGLFFWLKKTEENIIAKGGGSREETIRNLEENEGIDLSDKVEEEKIKALIQMILQTEIRPRVVVSWREIERFYHQNYQLFNPPGKLRLAIISLNKETEKEKIEEVKRRLVAGENFQDIAEDVGELNRGEMPGDPLVISRDGLTTFENENLHPIHIQMLQQLEGAENTTPQFERTTGSKRVYVEWLNVLSIEYQPSLSLYDPAVQTNIREQLYAIRFQEEQLRYFNELVNSDILNDMNEMAVKLIEIGDLRYRQ